MIPSNQYSNKVVLILGPTASGKTSISISSAIALGEKAEIVNFDSLYFFKELSIGTAKPTIEEMAGVKHHLIGICSIKSEMNASQFVKLATDKINEIHSRGCFPILVGGSAFYIRALLKGMYPQNEVAKEISRKKSDNLLKEKGIEYFIETLKKVDPSSFENIHINDHYRIIRACEYYWESGKKMSESKKKFDKENPYDFSENIHGWETLQIYLDLPKDEHFTYIEKRASNMLNAGLIDEIKSLFNNGFSGKEKAMNSIGYKETQAYLNHNIPTIEALIERITISTRQLAKSQRTFFKKITPKQQYHPLQDRLKVTKDILNFFTKQTDN